MHGLAFRSSAQARGRDVDVPNATRVFVDPSGRRARIVHRVMVTLVLLTVGSVLLLVSAVSVTPRVPTDTFEPRLQPEPPTNPHAARR